MNLAKEYEKIEREFLKCKDLQNIEIRENGESFISLSCLNHPNLKAEYKKKDMHPYFEGKMVVREDIAKRLISIANNLQKSHNPNIAIIIVYGYRALEIQKKYFNKYLQEVKKKNPHIRDINELRELTHRGAACPEVAGHPTGGAVDISLYDLINKKFVDMGSEILDYQNTYKAYTHSPEISLKQKENRLLLQEIMQEENFAPYLGEWWHFSYGDREWAKFYDKKFAIYDQIEHTNINLKEW